MNISGRVVLSALAIAGGALLYFFGFPTLGLVLGVVGCVGIAIEIIR